ncbi:MAG: hypothetical protein GXP63_00120 [DPANN group archaeon]|nr:hypothetical protein [DPANN group archaeon]
MFDAIFFPLDAIARAKAERSMTKTLLLLLGASLLTALSAFLMTQHWEMAVTVFVGVFLLNLFIAFLIKIALHVLIQRGGFYESLTALSLGYYISSFGFLVVVLIGMIPGDELSMTLVKGVLSGIALLSLLLLSAMTLFRATMEFFQVDLLTVVVTFTTLYLLLFISLYLGLLKIVFPLMFGLMGSSLPPVPLG